MKGGLTAAINHDASPLPFLENVLGGFLYKLVSIVGATGPTTEDNVYVLVAACLDDSCETLLGDAHECMGVGCRPHSINSN